MRLKVIKGLYRLQKVSFPLLDQVNSLNYFCFVFRKNEFLHQRVIFESVYLVNYEVVFRKFYFVLILSFDLNPYYIVAGLLGMYSNSVSVPSRYKISTLR